MNYTRKLGNKVKFLSYLYQIFVKEKHHIHSASSKITSWKLAANVGSIVWRSYHTNPLFGRIHRETSHIVFY